jgi:ABC-2 type transport system permease protein
VTEALHAEWTKIRTLTGTYWLVLCAVASMVGLSVLVAVAVHVASDNNQDPAKLSLAGVYSGQTVIAVLAVLAVTEEYDTGMIRTTLGAIPRRLTVLAAKATNLAGITLFAGLLAVSGCLVVGRTMLPADGLDPAQGYPLISIGQGPILRAAVGTILYLVLIAMLSLGVATAIRETAVSIGVVVGLLYLPRLLAQVVSDPLRRHLEQVAPMPAGLAIQATTHLHALPIAPWTGLGVLAAWAGAAMTAGGVLLQTRDA